LNSKILITGFGPFPGVPRNISSEVVTALAPAARKAFRRAAIIDAVLPTEWMAAPLLLEDLLEQHKPDVAVHFGVSHQARGFVVETSAQNASGHVDASGFAPAGERLLPISRDRHITAVPAARIVERLRRRGLPAYVSHDAGTYLCNAVYFHSQILQHHLNPGGRSVFVHLPTRLAADRGTPNLATAAPLGRADAVDGGLEIIATLLGQPAVRRAGGRIS